VMIQTWLDAVYRGEIQAAWEEKLRRNWRDGRRILSGLAPFQSDDELEKFFDQAFDTVEVIPAGLAPEYEPMALDDPIAASALLVPISHRRIAQLRRAGLVRTGAHPPIVDVPYSPEFGLDFSSIGTRDNVGE
jgi:hypothetical protein